LVFVEVSVKVSVETARSNRLLGIVIRADSRLVSGIVGCF